MKTSFIVFAILFSIVLCDLPEIQTENELLNYLTKVEEGTETLEPSWIQKVEYWIEYNVYSVLRILGGRQEKSWLLWRMLRALIFQHSLSRLYPVSGMISCKA